MKEVKIGDEVECIEGNYLKGINKGDINIVKDTDGNQLSFQNLPYWYPASCFKLAFTPEEFSVLNEADAEKYIGKVMEFADADGVRNKEWEKDKLDRINKFSLHPFFCKDRFMFTRTCPETFKTKDSERIKAIKESIACLKLELERLEGE